MLFAVWLCVLICQDTSSLSSSSLFTAWRTHYITPYALLNISHFLYLKTVPFYFHHLRKERKRKIIDSPSCGNVKCTAAARQMDAIETPDSDWSIPRIKYLKKKGGGVARRNKYRVSFSLFLTGPKLHYAQSETNLKVSGSHRKVGHNKHTSAARNITADIQSKSVV